MEGGKEKKHKQKKHKKNEKKELKEKKSHTDKKENKDKDKDRISKFNNLDKHSSLFHGESSQRFDTRIQNERMGNKMVDNSISKIPSEHVGTKKSAEKGNGFDTRMDENGDVHGKRTAPMIGKNDTITRDQKIHVDRSKMMEIEASKRLSNDDNKMANTFSTIRQSRSSSCMTEMDVVGFTDRKTVTNSITMQERQHIGTSKIGDIGTDLAANKKRVGSINRCIVENEFDGLFIKSSAKTKELSEMCKNRRIVQRKETKVKFDNRIIVDKYITKPQEMRKEGMTNLHKGVEKEKEIMRMKEKEKTKSKVKENCDDFEIKRKRERIDGILDGKIHLNKLCFFCRFFSNILLHGYAAIASFFCLMIIHCSSSSIV